MSNFNVYDYLLIASNIAMLLMLALCAPRGNFDLSPFFLILTGSAMLLMLTSCTTQTIVDGDDGQRDRWSDETRINANPSAMHDCPSRDLLKCRRDKDETN